jgi:hypothetical protein
LEEGERRMKERLGMRWREGKREQGQGFVSFKERWG